MSKKFIKIHIGIYLVLLIALSVVMISVGFKKDVKNRKSSINVSTGSIQTGEKKKVLIAYFSHTGTTEKLAYLIHGQIGGDMVKLEPKEPYPTDNEQLMAIVTKEQKEKLLPEIATKINNFDDYSIVFLGYPTWGLQYPRLIQTFLDSYDFDGKVIVPFNTYGGVGDSGMENVIAEDKPKAVVLDPLKIKSEYFTNDQTETVKKWLVDLGLLK